MSKETAIINGGMCYGNYSQAPDIVRDCNLKITQISSGAELNTPQDGDVLAGAEPDNNLPP
jgi:hypothetical protein